MLDRILAAAAGTVVLATGLACSQAAPQDAALVAKWKDAVVTDMKAKTLEGADANLAQHAGKVILFVNVASQCGLTPQYTGLQKIYDKYREQGLVVIGVPSGDFGGQEFDTAGEIREFCDTRYKVTFPILEKCGVKPGTAQGEVFTCLGTKTGELPGWNFGKYLVARDGKTATFFASTVAPESGKLVEAIEKALKEAAPAAPATSTAPAKPAEGAKGAGNAEKSPTSAEPAAPAAPASPK
jgi:glutathione peroxidase